MPAPADHTPAAPGPAGAPASPLTALAPGPVDPAAPWGMQIAVHYDKVHPARRVDVAEAAARAVVALLADPRAAEGGPWYEAVAHWRSGRIRKLVRRARGRRWEEVGALPGVTIAQDGPTGWAQARARALVPGPVRPLPPALAKTQVQGTHFPHGDRLPPPPAAVTAVVERGAASDGAAPAPPIELGAESASAGALVTVEVTPLETMTSGKLCAQVAHAAQLAWQSPLMPDGLRRAWARDGYRVRTAFPDRDQWEAAHRPVSVVDAGFTELDGPAETTRAFW